MNYANYIKYEFDKEINSKRNKRKIIILEVLNILLFVFNVLFSIFFIAYLVELTKSLHLHLESLPIQAREQRNLNTSLLICLIVFWVIYISFTIWFIWMFNGLFSIYKKILEEHNKLYIISFVFNILGLFICFLGIVGLGISFYLLLRIKKERLALIENWKNKKCN